MLPVPRCRDTNWRFCPKPISVHRAIRIALTTSVALSLVAAPGCSRSVLAPSGVRWIAWDTAGLGAARGCIEDTQGALGTDCDGAPFSLVIDAAEGGVRTENRIPLRLDRSVLGSAQRQGVIDPSGTVVGQDRLVDVEFEVHKDHLDARRLSPSQLQRSQLDLPVGIESSSALPGAGLRKRIVLAALTGGTAALEGCTAFSGRIIGVGSPISDDQLVGTLELESTGTVGPIPYERRVSGVWTDETIVATSDNRDVPVAAESADRQLLFPMIDSGLQVIIGTATDGWLAVSLVHQEW